MDCCVDLYKGSAGNCLSSDYPVDEMVLCGGKLFGEAGVKRFAHSVFREGKIDIVILLIGVNDLLYPFMLPRKIVETDVSQIIADYNTVTEIEKSVGVKWCAVN